MIRTLEVILFMQECGQVARQVTIFFSKMDTVRWAAMGRKSVNSGGDPWHRIINVMLAGEFIVQLTFQFIKYLINCSHMCAVIFNLWRCEIIYALAHKH